MARHGGQKKPHPTSPAAPQCSSKKPLWGGVVGRSYARHYMPTPSPSCSKRKEFPRHATMETLYSIGPIERATVELVLRPRQPTQLLATILLMARIGWKRVHGGGGREDVCNVTQWQSCFTLLPRSVEWSAELSQLSIAPTATTCSSHRKVGEYAIRIHKSEVTEVK